MKTKFILHGGFNTGQVGEDNSPFYKEILKEAPEGAKVLLVPFAKDADRIHLAVSKVSFEFNKNKTQKSIAIEVANEKDFMRQVQSANIIYLHGGKSLQLLEALQKYPDFGKILDGKTVAGESAGANVQCALFYSPQADGVFDGLGLLPLKIIPHYKKEYEGKLDGVRPDLEMLLLPEYEFRVFYK